MCVRGCVCEFVATKNVSATFQSYSKACELVKLEVINCSVFLQSIKFVLFYISSSNT